MDNSESAAVPDIVELTAEVVSAYVMNNPVQRADLPSVIASIHSSLASLGAPKQIEVERPVPAVPIKKSITHDYIISLEDGRQYKSLKRHLAGRGLSPEQYRLKWGLPPDYPMVAPSYAKQRSDLAKSMGLGKQPRGSSEPAPAPVPAAAAGRRRAKSVG